MIPDPAQLAVWGYALAAAAFVVFGLYVAIARRSGGAGDRLLVAVLCSAAWCASAALAAHDVTGFRAITELTGIVRDAGWLWFVLSLIKQLDSSGRRWPAILSLSLISVRAASAFAGLLGWDPMVVTVQYGLLLQLLTAVLFLVLIEQLYRTLPTESRWGLKPFCLALGAISAFDLYLFADGFLFGMVDPDVWGIRGLAHAAVIPLVAVSAARVPGWSIRLSVSRELVFHSTSLAVSGGYLLVVAAAGYYVRYFGGEWGRALQVAVLFFALLLLGVVLFSGTQRARLRVFLNKHLFPYRYDYRSEWLKFTRALDAGEGGNDLGQATVQALADLVESAGGGLWLDEGEGRLRMRARLNMPESDVGVLRDDPFCRFLADEGWVLNLDEYRMRPRTYGDFRPPQWLSELPDAWLVVPLIAGDELIGFVVLLTPRTPFDINWEVLDLLKTAQRQAASYLARMQAAEALIEARKFDAFNRMSAFVVHDLKNLVAQLSLMLTNAKRYKDNPEFQADMLETVAHVEQKMRDLMEQLQKKTAIDPDRPVELGELLEKIRRLRAQAGRQVNVDLQGAPAWVKANPERLERVVGHIVQNALDATGDDGMVSACLCRSADDSVIVRVTDTGSGMSAEFIRDQLFRPFQTTKTSGMGIGAFEARKYLRELGGDIRVESAPERGTTMELYLPLARTGPSTDTQTNS
ncbi:MAG: PEP-CTERM system histidine kinase PrsK [Porticoccaceae bacterium]|nr:PEP-CTERM system histidine kinase PrsK [Porticoccaceae bacterium]